MATYTKLNESTFMLKDDLRSDRTEKNSSVPGFIVVYLYIFFKRYIHETEELGILRSGTDQPALDPLKAIAGKALAGKIDEYMEKYPPLQKGEKPSAERGRHFYSLVDAFSPTEEKCRNLLHLIKNHSQIPILEDHECRDQTGQTLIIHELEIYSGAPMKKDPRNLEDDEKVVFIGAKMVAISQMGIKCIESTIENLQQASSQRRSYCNCCTVS